MQILIWTVVLVAVCYSISLSLLYFRQRDFIFPIPQTTRTSPEAAGFAQAEEHRLTTADGETIIVWHVPAKLSRPVIIYFHGNGDFLAAQVGRFQKLTADGNGLIAVSYRGYAGSSGLPSEQGLLQDAAAAYAFAKARYDAGQIVPWDFSLGTGVATALAAENAIQKLVLEAPYSSMVDVAAFHFSYVPVRWLLRDQFRSDLRVVRIGAPLLIMHGDRDRTIPVRFGERLFDLALEPKQFVRFPEGGHDDLASYGAIETGLKFIRSGGG
ncbi:alpha/beta hydrolase [Rhodopseudomonas boonkerdii]|uniref:alpha/beta hydrolase n=1 Tax=Rhodopseudomonas boonkerdii TaxID=475937 RepID=UPI001E36D3B0|nr:alpha/beta hydrolase [Rhodopseudomonas boonkerdii]UGV28070.1 alpha/beta hydrolase [Rhodopseudomonas boonkerdii]